METLFILTLGLIFITTFIATVWKLPGGWSRGILLALAAIPFEIFLIWELLKLSLDDGPRLNIGFSLHLNELLILLLGFVVPIILGICYMVKTKAGSALKRFLFPIALVLVVMLLSGFVIRHVARAATASDMPYAECAWIYGPEDVLQEVCPNEAMVPKNNAR